MTLSPFKGPIVLLPEDKELISALGITEAQYRHFCREALKRSRIEPGKPQALLLIPFVINLVVGLALSYVGSLLTPKSSGGSPNIRQTQKQGQNIVSQTEFAPKAGFDSLQNVVELGSTVPVIYAGRETLDGVIYGGVRVNTNLLWSQMQSFGGNQLLRAIFLIGEGGLGNIDPSQFAFGDNTISSYDLGLGNANNSRVTFYYSPNGGRITSADRIAGRLAAKDPGNAENNNAPDVFCVRGLNDEWTTDFCYAYKPATQTQFGVSALTGVGFGYRINPSMRPAVIVKTQPEGDKGKVKLQCDPDGVAIAQRNKYNNKFSTYSGITQINGTNYNSSGLRTLNVGDTVTYFLNRKSDAKKIFKGNQKGTDHKETCNDVAQTVAGRQKTYDDNLSIGDLYKLGTAHLICEERSPNDQIFSSEIDQEPVGGGQSITVTFRVVKSGVAVIRNPSASTNATSSSHLLKLAICSFTISRAAQVLELGFRSALGIRLNGLCNFRDSLSHTVIDGKACNYYKGRIYGKGQSLGLSNYSSGSFSGAERRYSFFKLGYRVAGSNSDFTFLNPCFGFKGVTQQNQFNYMRLEMPSFEVWEFRIEPLSGWEIRSGKASGSLEILDAKMNSRQTANSQGVKVVFSGETISRNRATFQMASTKDRNLGVVLQDSKDYADDWGRLAEAFVFEEIQSSAKNPEHELAYVNLITPNLSVPVYDNLALIGMNIRSTTEFTQLKQLSVYISEGLISKHTFPQILQDLLLNQRYGVGTTVSPEQVDSQSYTTAGDWTYLRRYFWDGTLPEPVNIRQWASTTASYFLLDFVIRNGKFTLQPAVYFNQPEVITNLYTSGNILEDTFEFSYADVEQRTPKRVSIKWRHERPSNTNNSPGIFPLIREINVREVGTPDDAPLESIDLSDFCTSQKHAVDVGKFLCRTSRLITHSISFKTIPTKASLEIGRCFKLGLETVNYSQPNNGIIDATGAVISIDPISNGTYTVLLWDGVTTSIQEVSLTITNGITSQYTNVVFCLKESVVDTVAYKVQSISFDEDGNLQVEATVFPLMSNGYSLITDGWDVDQNWIIEGLIGTSQDNGSSLDYFTGITIVGPSSLTLNTPEEYTAIISGSSGSYSYQWSGSNLTFSQPNASTTEIIANALGNLTVQVQITGNGVTLTQTKELDIVDANMELNLIGTVSISGPTTVVPSVPYIYTSSYANQPAAIAASSVIVGESYQITSIGTTDFTIMGASDNTVGTVFTATAVGTGSGTVGDIDLVFTSWSWDSTTPGASLSFSDSGYPITTVTYDEGGTYNLRVDINSPTAIDSPQFATLAILVQAPIITVIASDPDASEDGSNPGSFTITRTGITTYPLTVYFKITGTATNGLDYTQITESATFAVGSSTSSVQADVLPDSLIEDPETVTLLLIEGPGYTVGSSNIANITIKDAVCTVSVTATDSDAAETTTGTTSNLGQFTISRTGISSTDLLVNFSLTGTAVNGLDYTTIASPISLPANTSSVIVDVTVIDDAVIETAETVILTLLSGTGYSVGSNNSAQIIITDNDLPNVSIIASDPNAAEPSDAATFILNRTGFTDTALNVNLTTTGTAIPNTDYTAIPTTITFSVGSNSVSIPVTPIDDSVSESPETVTTTISAGTGYVVGVPSTATVTLFDNESSDTGPPTITVVASDAVASEPSDPGIFTFTRTGATTDSLTVNISVSGTATPSTDYIALASTVIFNSGSSTADITVTPIDDAVLENSESVIVSIIAGTGYLVASPSSATVTLLDNENSGGSGTGGVVTPLFSNVSILLHLDGANGSTTFADSSLNNIAVTGFGAAQITTAQFKFNQSLLLNGTTSYLQIPQSNLFLFTADFTVEIWYYLTSNGQYDTILEIGNAGYSYGVMVRAGTLNPGLFIGGTKLGAGPYMGSLNIWNHAAIVRYGQTITGYINGSAIGVTNITSSVGAPSGQLIYIGQSVHASGRFVTGYVDEMRVVKNQACYLSNFVPLGGPFPNS